MSGAAKGAGGVGEELLLLHLLRRQEPGLAIRVVSRGQGLMLLLLLLLGVWRWEALVVVVVVVAVVAATATTAVAAVVGRPGGRRRGEVVVPGVAVAVSARMEGRHDLREAITTYNCCSTVVLSLSSSLTCIGPDRLAAANSPCATGMMGLVGNLCSTPPAASPLTKAGPPPPPLAKSYMAPCLWLGADEEDGEAGRKSVAAEEDVGGGGASAMTPSEGGRGCSM